jgi:hypothetical protein
MVNKKKIKGIGLTLLHTSKNQFAGKHIADLFINLSC